MQNIKRQIMKRDRRKISYSQRGRSEAANLQSQISVSNRTGDKGSADIASWEI